MQATKKCPVLQCTRNRLSHFYRAGEAYVAILLQIPQLNSEVGRTEGKKKVDIEENDGEGKKGGRKVQIAPNSDFQK